MGFFDRKKKAEDELTAEEDQPDQSNHRSSMPQSAPPQPIEAAAIAVVVPTSMPPVLAAPPKPPPKASALPPPPPRPPPFGIDEAVALFRQLPSRSTDLVIQVVKKTLESVGVDVVQIVDAATAREQDLDKRTAGLRLEIDRLESEIATHKRDIARLEAESKEISSVKERLVQAHRAEVAEAAPSDRPQPARPPPVPAAAPSVPPAVPASKSTPQ